MPKMTVAMSRMVVADYTVFIDDDITDSDELVEAAQDKVQEMIDNREFRDMDLEWEDCDDNIAIDDVYPA